MEKDIKKQVGKVLKRLRTQAGYTQPDLAERLGVDRANVSRYESGKQGMEIDRLAMVPQIFNVSLSQIFAEAEGISDTSHPSENYVRFERLNVYPSAGTGSELIDYPEVVQEIDVLESWARQTLGIVDPNRIKIISCKGDSMTPTIRPGDIVFVDTSIRAFMAEGIYVLAWQNNLLIKRLRALFDNRLAIQSDNKTDYETEYVPAEQADQLAICGKVVGWWTLRKNS